MRSLGRMFLEQQTIPLAQGFYFCNDSFGKPPVGTHRHSKVRLCFLGKFDRIGRSIPCFFLMAASDVVLPCLTCFLARAIAVLSSLCDRMSRVSINPSNSSLLGITALSTPFLVIVNRSYFSFASFTIEERLFFASARGKVFTHGGTYRETL